ncbi:MAG: alpha/beta hydrolase [Acidobacteria bacterium]|jgi:predicted alpha/beta-fold hydrolase|nr:MAG: alpha/beta hydrolase [Acidobacteriota bacterium]
MVDNSQSPKESDSFIPRRWLRGGHLQTLGSFLISRRFNLPVPEKRLIEVAPCVEVLCHCHWQAERTKPLTIIIVHGLEGSSESQYVRGITEKALAAGMNVVRYNQRNCGGTEELAPVLYHSGLSDDVAAVARHLIEKDGISQFALAGFSMGGNLVLKLAGEWGSQGPRQFRALAACCPALDLAASADALHEPANRIYELYFLFNLRRRMMRKARLFPKHFDVSRMRGMHSLRDFDHQVTAFYCGFSGADDYYARSSASNVIDKIAVPTLIVHATNDPFIRILPETRRKIAVNSNITFVEVEDGGHCAFVGRRNGMDDGFWAESQIVNFLGRF